MLYVQFCNLVNEDKVFPMLIKVVLFCLSFLMHISEGAIVVCIPHNYLTSSHLGGHLGEEHSCTSNLNPHLIIFSE